MMFGGTKRSWCIYVMITWATIVRYIAAQRRGFTVVEECKAGKVSIKNVGGVCAELFRVAFVSDDKEEVVLVAGSSEEAINRVCRMTSQVHFRFGFRRDTLHSEVQVFVR